MKNREAIAMYMAFANALHDTIHAGLLDPAQVVALMGIAQHDFKTLIATGKVEMRGHKGEFTEIDGPAGKATDNTITQLIEMAAMPEGTVTGNGTLN